jgi:hypothetical protein
VDESKSPAERLLDLVVFGPAGLALTATEEFPKLVDKGRHHLEGQIRTARLVGQVAVQLGRRQLDQLVSQRPSKPSSPPRTTPPAPAAPVSTVTAPEPAAPHGRSEAPAPRSAAATPSVNGNGSAGGLAIPGYDSLSASQVVQRLAGLSRGELIEVRAHEQAQRHRRTILNRVEQLLAGVDAE